LSLPADSAAKGHILELLQSSAAQDLKDFFVFTIGQQLMGLNAAPEGGARREKAGGLPLISSRDFPDRLQLKSNLRSRLHRLAEVVGLTGLDSVVDEECPSLVDLPVETKIGQSGIATWVGRIHHE
jgi:hypothetical protein